MTTAASPAALPADWRDFFALTKPRVMTLVIFTGICGLLAAPGAINPILGFTAILCIAMGAGGSAALNQWWEADIDAGMKRTAKRPLPSGRMQATDARDFGILISVASVGIMGIAINWLSAIILAAAIVYYAVIYTIWLKPRTPQNIVIGGGAGAFPPMIGWVAVTGEITLMPVLLFAIIFMWTPPHFWALALFVKTDYEKVGIPMMPVVKGEASTRRQILVYSILLIPFAVAPWAIGATGAIYGVSALLLTGAFAALSVPVATRRQIEGDTMKPEKRLFGFSILYLFALFAALVADRYLTPLIESAA
ncbi:heme o synthase [Erythrobacter litoralis]|uniref:Protoheme IX farnesyltransferase n=1 Tax=Erythrobacter litoralis (strain HTCC2594) TaxID=314225 RepID=COXX_ERYLH|nr:heme o synthase [Erythrobacter litoralis]Q2NCF2.1 RecName: Full=Protoheme IX farnesyltransferase; AltName: Full=Heme B farnesyltransferase; AltName: Full=Heme O synthase [Erythrobacter litoralis HTCC2594]ABC62639.1 heme O synthase [Erythrobacter litoralis HTCC2594]